MSDILNKILAVKAQEVAAAQKLKPIAEMRAEAEQAAPTRDFVAATVSYTHLTLPTNREV